VNPFSSLVEYDFLCISNQMTMLPLFALAAEVFELGAHVCAGQLRRAVAATD
jgi:hypothetical protein